jgi:hypothetical protein
VDDHINPRYTPPNVVPVSDGTNSIGEVGCNEVDADDVVVRTAHCANQRFTEMS